MVALLSNSVIANWIFSNTFNLLQVEREDLILSMITGWNFECAEHLQCCVTQCHILFVLLVRLGQYRLELILQFVLLVRIAAVT